MRLRNTLFHESLHNNNNSNNPTKGLTRWCTSTPCSLTTAERISSPSSRRFPSETFTCAQAKSSQARRKRSGTAGTAQRSSGNQHETAQHRRPKAQRRRVPRDRLSRAPQRPTSQAKGPQYTQDLRLYWDECANETSRGDHVWPNKHTGW